MGNGDVDKFVCCYCTFLFFSYLLHLMKRVATDQPELSSKSKRPTADLGNIEGKSTIQQPSADMKATNAVSSASQVEKVEEKPSSSETRPKEGTISL